MYLFKKVKDLQQYLDAERDKGSSIGYVPTMGALHQGHLALIEQSIQKNTITVCSIFVNPTQFDDKKDLEKYPRPIEVDIEQLEVGGCDVLFLPTVEEIYPPSLETFSLDLAGLDETMEGAKRSGHFAGVVQVVHRLLDIVQPNKLYMGQKDYQQFTIIKYMLQQTNAVVELVRVPIVRESDGLAMSSRNVRLSEVGREQALHLSKALFQARKDALEFSPQAVKQRAASYLMSNGLELDYFEVVDGDTLQSIKNWEDASSIVACATVRVDGVRLLDNVLIKEKGVMEADGAKPAL